jgi:hypothetical protein
MNTTPRPESDLMGKVILVRTSLAQKIGLNEAIVVQQLHFLLAHCGGGKVINGDRWIFNTYEQWQSDHFPYWSIRTLKRIFANLESMLLVESCQPDGAMSRKKYYRLNFGMWSMMLSGSLPFPENPDGANLAPSNGTELPLPKQRALNTEVLKEPKETPAAAGVVVPSVWKPDNQTKAEKLRTLRVPPFPSEREFEHFLETEGLDSVICYRSELYSQLCDDKWHQWREGTRKWVRIRNWRRYVAALEESIRASMPGGR